MGNSRRKAITDHLPTTNQNTSSGPNSQTRIGTLRLTAIAAGKTTSNEIARTLGIGGKQISTYTHTTG